MNKNQILLEINAAIAAMLDSNWSYFSAPSYMKGFFADGIIRCLLYDAFCDPIYHMLVCTAYIWTFFVRIYMRVCKKMVIYLGIKRKYTWQKNARISCSRNDCKYTWEKTARISSHNFETNGRPYLTWDKTTFAVLIRGIIFSLVKNIVRTPDWRKLTGV